MNRRQLVGVLTLHADTTEVVPGYNYNAFTIRVKKADAKAVAQRLRDNKEKIETLYREKTGETDWPGLLDFVAIPLMFTVWVPVPHTPSTALNVFAEAVDAAVPGLAIPQWS